MPDNAGGLASPAILHNVKPDGKVVDVLAEQEEVVQILGVFCVLKVELVSLVKVPQVEGRPGERHPLEALLHVAIEAITPEHEHVKAAILRGDVDPRIVQYVGERPPQRAPP